MLIIPIALSVVSLTSFSFGSPKNLAPQKLLRLIEALEAKQPIRPDDVSKICGVRLAAEADQPNPYYIIRTGKVVSGKYAGFIESVELRTPLGSGRGGVLNIFINKKQKIDAQYFTEKYPSASYNPASATTPVSVPNDIRVQKAWGELHLGISRDGSNRVEMFSLQAKRSGN